MKPNDTALRKRSQISKANRTMFLWIAIASALVGFVAVVAILLGQKLIFNEKLLMEKAKTQSILKANNEAIEGLQTEVRVLDTNEALIKNKAKPDNQALQVILDALPSEANSPALGASLQARLLVNIPGLIAIDSLQVDPVEGIESLDGGAVQDGSSSSGDTANEITFRFSVIGNQDALRQVLTNLQRSIRIIDVTRIQVENRGTDQVMTVEGRAFYEPARVVKLYDKVVNP